MGYELDHEQGLELGSTHLKHNCMIVGSLSSR